MAKTTTPVGETHNPYDYRDTDSPQVIKAQIEETRAHMSHTIDAIQQRLSPQHLMQQAKESAKEATIGKVEEMTHQVSHKAQNWRQSMVYTVRQNPIPSALIGIGLGWLLFGSNDTNDDYYSYDYPTNEEVGVRTASTRYFDRAQVAAEQEGDTVSGRISGHVADAGSKVKEKAADAVSAAHQKTRDTAEKVQQKAGETAAAVQQKVGETASGFHHRTAENASWASRQTRDNTRYYTDRAKDHSRTMFYSNPLAVGAAALAAGALVGLLVPTTQKEHELMGETRDQMLDQAQAKVNKTVEKVQHVAEETQHAAKETAKREAEKQNLTSST